MLRSGLLFAFFGLVAGQAKYCEPVAPGSVHDFSATLLDGSDTVNFADYAGKQEPGANATEIYNALANVRPGGGFVPNFQLFAKSEVNGPNASALYKYLKGECQSPLEPFLDKLRLAYDSLNSRDIRWNFEKFLIDRDGKPYARFAPYTIPEDIPPFIEELLALDSETKRHQSPLLSL
ncbi:unnamed protein product [Notodromas monacha]|uniref:glutathione peroxidase n=1 Tax=Notodromas monacha TaxID=399045 RepID=A0A7R9BU35_9CRUS|nr:unnamed protein product [Notodromas monacha]CAG0920379.1 unnamed protein product [Notodromas monacha]